MTKKILAIWAEDNNHLIGKDGKLPWHLPKDLAHFKETTQDQAVLMGRVTFEGMGSRPLPKRDNLILTRDQDFKANGVTVCHSVADVMTWFNQQEKNLYIAGGSEIYRLFGPYYDGLVQTVVDGSFAGDTHFPALDFSVFDKVSSEQFAPDEKNAHAFTVNRYKRHKGVKS